MSGKKVRKAGAGSPDPNIPNSLLNDRRVTHPERVLLPFDIGDVLVHLVRVSFPSCVSKEVRNEFNRDHGYSSVSLEGHPLGVVLADYADRLYADGRYNAISGYFLDSVSSRIHRSQVCPRLVELMNEYFLSDAVNGVVDSDRIMMLLIVFKDLVNEALMKKDMHRADEILRWFMDIMKKDNENGLTIDNSVQEWVVNYDILVSPHRALNLVVNDSLLTRPSQSRPQRPEGYSGQSASLNSALVGTTDIIGLSSATDPQTQTDDSSSAPHTDSPHKPPKVTQPIRIHIASQPLTTKVSRAGTSQSLVQSQAAQQSKQYFVPPTVTSAQVQIPSISQLSQTPIIISGSPNLTHLTIIQQPQQSSSQQNTSANKSAKGQLSSTQTVVPPTLVLRQPASTVAASVAVTTSQQHASNQTPVTEAATTAHGLFFGHPIVRSAPTSKSQTSTTQTVVPPTLVLRQPASTVATSVASSTSQQHVSNQTPSTATVTTTQGVSFGRSIVTSVSAAKTVPPLSVTRKKPIAPSYSTIQVIQKVEPAPPVQTTNISTTMTQALVPGQTTSSEVSTAGPASLTVQTTSIAMTTVSPSVSSGGATLPQPTPVQAAAANTSANQPTAGTREYTREHLQSLADGVGLTLTDWHLRDSRVTRQDPIRFSSEEIIYYMISSRLVNLPPRACDALKKRIKPADLVGTRLGIVLNDYFAAITRSTSFRQMLQEFGANVSSTQTAHLAFRDFLMKRILPRTGAITFDRMMAAVLMAIIIAIKSIKQGDSINALFVLRLATAALEITDHRRNIVRNGWALMQAAREALINRTTFNLFYSLRPDGSVDVSESEANFNVNNQVSPYLVVPTVSQSATQVVTVAGASVTPTDSAAPTSSSAQIVNLLVVTADSSGPSSVALVPVPAAAVIHTTGPSMFPSGSGVLPSTTPVTGVSAIADNSSALSSTAPAAVQAGESNGLSSSTTATSSPIKCCETSVKRVEISQDDESHDRRESSPSKDSTSKSKHPAKKKPRNDLVQSEPEEDVDDNYYFNRLAQSGVISQEEAAMQQAIVTTLMSSTNEAQKESSTAQVSTSKDQEKKFLSRGESSSSKVSPSKKKPRNDPEKSEPEEDVDNNDYFKRLAQSGVISQEEAEMQQAIVTTLMSSGNKVQEESSTEQASTSAHSDSQIKGDPQSIVESSQCTKRAGDILSETDSYTTADTELVDAGQASMLESSIVSADLHRHPVISASY